MHALATLEFELLILGLKLFWTITNRFGRVQLILKRLKSFWTGSDYKN